MFSDIQSLIVEEKKNIQLCSIMDSLANKKPNRAHLLS